MKTLKYILAVGGLLALCVAFATPYSSVTLAWDASPDPTVVGYRCYYGGASRTYTNVTDCGNVLTCTVTNLVPGDTYFFAVTAYNAAGLESDFSGEVSYTDPYPPTAPSNLSPSLHKN